MPRSIRAWKAADRQTFITKLTETGDPTAAAKAIGRSLAAAFAMRDRCPQLADEWRRALGLVWEQLEMRVLTGLLEGEPSDIDAKVALEMLKRRPAAPARPLLNIDAAKIAAVRDDIRALAPPTD